MIHLLVPQLTQVDVDAPVKPISLGTIVGFGFVGGVFGTFAWIVGLVNAAGPAMLTYLAIGAGIGGILGIIAGMRSLTARPLNLDAGEDGPQVAGGLPE